MANARNIEEVKELHGEGGSDVFTSTRHVNPNAVSLIYRNCIQNLTSFYLTDTEYKGFQIKLLE